MLWNTGENQVIDGLILTFQFFTRIPINKEVDFNEKNIRYCLFFYPFVGALLGSIAAGVFLLLSMLNNEIAAIVTVVTLIILTGGLHIDGLSDTFDGFLSNRDKGRTLEIMKDSRVGSFGVLSTIILILTKFVIISNFGEGLTLALILSMVNSRLEACRVISTMKVARKGGLGDLFHNSNPRNLILFNSIIYIGILFIINFKLFTPLMITYIFNQLFCRWSYKKIDGMTGDTYGAIIEIGEVVSLISYWGIMAWI